MIKLRRDSSPTGPMLNPPMWTIENANSKIEQNLKYTIQNDCLTNKTKVLLEKSGFKMCMPPWSQSMLKFKISQSLNVRSFVD